MIAHAPLEKGAAVEADLDRLAAVSQPARHPAADRDRDRQQLLPAPGFLEALRLLPARHLTFDICVKHWGLVFAIELARRCPDVSFVLDHIGKPGIRDGLVEPWKSQMRSSRTCPTWSASSRA